jgi:hypothetical protein
MNFHVQVACLAAIQRLAARAIASPIVTPAFAGTATVQPAPDGLAKINKIQGSGPATLGTTGGLTLIPNAAAFTAPTFDTQRAFVRKGSTVEHYAIVQKTSSNDVIHQCYYPGKGEHFRTTQQINGQLFTHFWEISQDVSQLIRQGEEEHLADAQRAYELTYKLIADTINSMAGPRFGPATTPAEADKLALAELAKRLPMQLGTDPKNWVAVLDRLLKQTKTRDDKHWHDITTNPPKTKGNTIIHEVVMGPDARIGKVPSSQVVNY